MRRKIALVSFLLVWIVSCGDVDERKTTDEDAALAVALREADSPEAVEQVLDLYLRPLVEETAGRVEEIIEGDKLDNLAKHRLVADIFRAAGPTLTARADLALRLLENRNLGDKAEDIRFLLRLARALGIIAGKTERPLYWELIEGQFGTRPHLYEFSPDLPAAVADRFWLMYHWTEIMGGMYDDSEYAWVFADSGRTGFLAQEAGASGFEQFHDWWSVAGEVWNDPELTYNQKLMAAKYTMWQNPDWGGGEHYIDEWWAWEAAYKEEDCALFTGNNLAALAALYEMTRDERTLQRMQAIMAAFWHFDRLTRDDPDPLALEEPDGRITRGTKTRQLYYESERNLFDVEIVGGQIVTYHNNSEPDLYTGRERKNVSRDQYYGMLLGYRVLWEVLTGLPDRTAAEQALLDNLVEHVTLVGDYLFKNSRYHLDWGWEYMLYALFEGSCANPPNLSFMAFWCHEGIEEMTGVSYLQFDALHDFGDQLLEFGRDLGLLEISESLFEPAHSGLTGLNQYLSAFYMSDITPADWMFLWPPELVDLQDAGQRRNWRRVVAAFYRKFGMLFAPQYEAIAAELFDEVVCPRPGSPEVFFNSYQGDLVKLDATHEALEEFLLPFAFLAGRAANRETLAAELTARYQALIENGDIDFDATDLPYQ